MTTVTFENVTKSFGSVRAVAGLTCVVQPGRVTAFLGPNGAGKTTSLRMLLGLVEPTSGTVLIDGRCYRDLLHPRAVLGAVLGPDGFHPGRTGRNHLRVIAFAAGLPEGRVDEVLDLVELSAAAGRRVGGYSLGMRQRLGLATALLGDPEVLVADEPTNGLDPEGVAWLRGFLREMAAQGRSVLLSSHLLAEVARTADEVLVMSQGRLRFSGTLEALAENGGGDDVDALEAAFLRLTGPVAA